MFVHVVYWQCHVSIEAVKKWNLFSIPAVSLTINETESQQLTA